MVMPKIQIAPERIADGKRLYDLTLTPVADIAAMMGVSRKTLERRIHEWGWTPRSAPRHATDRMLVALAPSVINAAPAIAVPLSPEARAALAARIHGIVAQSLDAVERVLAVAGPADEVGAERSARTIAAVARTLTEYAVFTKPDDVTLPDDIDDHDPIPRDIDAVREALALRIEAFIAAERRGEGAADPDVGDASRAERP